MGLTLAKFAPAVAPSDVDDERVRDLERSLGGGKLEGGTKRDRQRVQRQGRPAWKSTRASQGTLQIPKVSIVSRPCFRWSVPLLENS